MCGRYTLTKELHELAKRFEAEMTVNSGISPVPRFNIAPTQSVIVVNDTGKRQIVTMRWGLIPSWATDESIGNRMINARAETIAEKPAFRAALKKRCCLIPADGFYEWTTKPVGPAAPSRPSAMKQPLRIVLKNREVFAFAGLWERWKSPTGDEIPSCTIITTEANELLKQVHERMPVILSKEDEALWLDPKIDDPAKLLPLLKRYPAELMEFYPVDRNDDVFASLGYAVDTLYALVLNRFRKL